jgi:hypothetical protein
MSKRSIIAILAFLIVMYMTWLDHNGLEADRKMKETRERHQILAETKLPFIKSDNFRYRGDFDTSNNIPVFGVQTHPSQWMIPDS